MATHPLLFALLLGGSLLAPLDAQPPPAPPSDGPLIAMPSVFTIDPATVLGPAGVREAEMWLKARGYSTSGLPPAPLPSSGIDFTAAALFGGCMPAPYPDVDAMSLGLDIIPVTATGTVAILPGHWNFLSLSVRRGTTGTAGGAIAAEVGTLGGNEADFFSYIFRGASCVPPEYVDKTFKLADSLDFGMPVVSEIDGIDLYANLYDVASSSTSTLALPVCPLCPSVYFSVDGSAANLARVPASWWGGSTPSGAVVFRSTWTGTTWTCPVVHFTPAALGLSDCEDLDGLAYEAYGAPAKVLLSTEVGGCVARDQLLLVMPGGDLVTPVPITYTNGDLVSKQVGIKPGDPGDDVDGICAGDPICAGGQHQGQFAVRLEETLGYPWDASITLGFPRRLGLQALRTPAQWSSPVPFRYDLHLIGGHPGGPGVLAFSVRGLYPNLPVTVPFLVPTVSRIVGNPVLQKLSLQSSLRGIDVIVQSATLSRTNPTDLRISYAVGIPLR